MNTQKLKGFYCSYNNPKRKAYHEAGHIVALFLFTGDIKALNVQKDKSESPIFNTIKRNRQVLTISKDHWQAFKTIDEYHQIFNEVCFWIAGGVAEKVYCNLRGLPQNTMMDDLDVLMTHAKHEWQFPFKQIKNGFPSCPILDNMIQSAVNLIESLFRSMEIILKIRAVTEYLISGSLVSTNILIEIQKNAQTNKELLALLKG